MVVPYPKYPAGLTFEESARLRLESRQFILARYDEGVPFYSKDIFRKAAEQFELCLQGGKSEQEVSLVGLDGTPVRLLVEPGKDINEGREPSWPGYKVLRTKPRLEYRNLHQLTSDHRPSWSPDRAYLVFDIVQSTEIHDLAAGKVVDPWPMADVETVRQRLRHGRSHWDSTLLFGRARSILAATGVLPSINNVVALACGSITRLVDDLDSRRSVSQHALVLAVRDFVENNEKGEGTVKCFAQDPIYVPMDKQVLGEVGITVVDDPSAWLEVDEGSVVIAIAPTIPVEEVLADIARPVAIITLAPENL
ncbi:hypothetical protein C8A01DRAFT_18456 [Parachaetomium inaequale]|uniref:SRR1-like domain-containing protein n=1 Tax=Parachaetomium inaequale TaxID=2588326 RepID=A0AAN6SPG8_9PEZI|nr:hypothetical protein C8A01DRAFT_18456 [Parachaetomium inaequale]